MLWNSVADKFGYFGYIGLGIVAWIIAFKLVMVGLKQVEGEKKA